MSWKLVFDGGPLDGTELDADEAPGPVLTAVGPVGPHRRLAMIDAGFDLSACVETCLLLPGQSATYQLAFGTFPGPLRYRLAKECLEPF